MVKSLPVHTFCGKHLKRSYLGNPRSPFPWSFDDDDDDYMGSVSPFSICISAHSPVQILQFIWKVCSVTFRCPLV